MSLKSYLLVIFALSILSSCNNSPSRDKSGDVSIEDVKQLNITILLDLSDRLVQELQPDQSSRDIEIVTTIVGIFKEDMKNKGAFGSRGKIRVLLSPYPNNQNISQLSQNLNIDLTQTNTPAEKKYVFDNIDSIFSSSLSQIYDMTLETHDWLGSDIWRFFKYDIAELCIEPKPYQNILIIITDGYIYHRQSIERVANRTSYIYPKFFSDEGFRGNHDWEKKFIDGDYGLISFDSDLSELDVLIVEINPSKKNLNDEDYIRLYIKTWLNEMKVNSLTIFNTDLPVNTYKRLNDYFKSAN